MPETRTKGAESLRKALNIINIVGEFPHGISLTKVIGLSELTRPTAYRMIGALTEEGFLTVDDSKKLVTLGHNFLRLAQRAWSDGDLRETAQEALTRLANDCHGLALLMVRSGQMMSCIELAGDRSVFGGWHVGSAEPIIDSIAGRALLAFSDWDEIDDTLNLLTANSDAHSIKDLRAELAVSRSRFYAVGAEVGTKAAWSVAAPVFDFAGKPIAAIALFTDGQQRENQTIHDMGASVMQAARHVSSKRGGYPFGIDVPARLSEAVVPEIRTMVETRCLIGDSPVVVPKTGDLFWIDILAPSLHRYDPATKKHIETPLSEVVGAAIPFGEDHLLLAEQSHLRILDGRGREVRRRQVTELPSGFRFNDGTLDSRRRLWLGAMDMATSRGTGQLMRFDTLEAAPIFLPGFSLPNGIAISPSEEQMYVIDSMERTLSIFRYDIATGNADLGRRIPLLSDEDGRPSGIALLPDGDIVTCHWDGAAVLRLSADGKIKARLPLPVPRPSGITVHPDGDRLIVTTARVRLSEFDLSRFPLAGAVLSVPL